jgi:hypothetical protein
MYHPAIPKAGSYLTRLDCIDYSVNNPSKAFANYGLEADYRVIITLSMLIASERMEVL